MPEPSRRESVMSGEIALYNARFPHFSDFCDDSFFLTDFEVNLLTKLIISVAVVGALVWFTASVSGALSPFVLAAVIAYIASPFAEKLERRNAPPALSAAIIVVVLLLAMVLLPLALLPIISAQILEFTQLLPQLIEKLNTLLGSDVNTWLQERQIDLAEIGSGGSLTKAAGIAADLFSGGIATLSSFFTFLLITPLAAFYLVRDRKSIGGELIELLPPHIRDVALIYARDLDGVLDEFLHGQLLVMLIMALFYSLVLKFAGLPFAVTIGIISGLLTFIPYVGFILGIILATLVGITHFEAFGDMAIIWTLMIIGTTIESILITPRLVGERIGLHPLAVLLALMVMGELFGFVGILASLPTAAVILVCGRHLRRRYIGSNFYGKQ